MSLFNKATTRCVRRGRKLRLNHLANPRDRYLRVNTLTLTVGICDMTHDICEHNSPMSRVLPLVRHPETDMETFVRDPCAENFPAVWISESFWRYRTLVFLTHDAMHQVSPNYIIITESIRPK